MNKTQCRYLQANNAAKEIFCTTRHTATLIQFYFETHRRLPTVIYTNPNEKKKKGTSLRASSLFATATELVPARAVGPLVGPLVRTVVVVKGRALRPVSAVSGPRAARLAPGSPFLVADGNREGCADLPHRSPLASRKQVPNQRKQVKRAQRKKKEESTHARCLAEVKKKSEPPMYASFIPRVCKYLDHRGPVGGATLARWGKKRGREPPWIQTFAYTVLAFP